MVQRRPAAWLAVPVGVLLLAGCTGAAGGAPSPTPTGSGEVDVVELAVGDCLNIALPPRPAASVPVVDCSAEHEGEAYASVVLDDAEFPGEAEVRSRAESGCTEAFAGFAGIDYDSSSLDYAYYFPTAGSWKTGDRRILCLVLDPAGPVTGSLEGAAR